jgi:hypothetical protein
MCNQQLVLARPAPGRGRVRSLSDAPVNARTPATTGIGHTGQAVSVITTTITGTESRVSNESSCQKEYTCEI